MQRFIDGHQSAAIIFRRIAGNVGLRHDFRGLMVGFINNGDSRAGADTVHAAFPHEVVVVNRRNNAPGNIPRAFAVAVRQQQAKLIAAQTGQNIGGAQHTQHQRGELTQQGVASGMPGGIVHCFKAIEIDKYQRMTLM